MQTQIEITYDAAGKGKEIIFHADKAYKMPYDSDVMLCLVPFGETVIIRPKDSLDGIGSMIIVNAAIRIIDHGKVIARGNKQFTIIDQTMTDEDIDNLPIFGIV